jgi:sigma-B regulation protein RsbU (phosphoserine phosphatase)
MTGNDVIPRRLDDGLAWIADVGRAFSDATGWPMVFQPHGEPRRHGGSPETCWSSEIRDSAGPLGRLQIELPEEPGRDRAFMTICELSGLIASLVSRVVGTAEALERRNRDVALLLEADAAGQRHASLQGLLEEYLRLCAELSGFRQVAFFLLSPDGRELHLRAVHGLRPADVPVPLRQLAVVPPDVTAFDSGMLEIHAEGESAYRRWLPADARRGVCLPVNCDSGPAGSLWLYDRRSGKRKAESGKPEADGHESAIDGVLPCDELRVIRRMADRIAAVLERVVLLHESEIHHRQNSDLQIASQCQRESVPPLQLDDPAFDVAAVCTSRFELGGDLCEVLPLGEQQVFVAVGDASGDSVPAAMVMSAVRGAVRALLADGGDELPDLPSILQRANQTLIGLSATFQFMSLFLGIVDARGGTLTYSNAGHPPPFLIRRGEIEELSSHGTTTVPFEPEDALVAYSDGVSEVMNEDDRIFGTQGITAALGEAPLDSAAGILQTVTERLERFASPGNNHGDDRTLLVLRLR